MLGSIIGSIMANYNPEKAKERLKPIQVIKARLKKFMYQRSRTNPKDFAIATANAHIAWSNAVKHFANRNMSIEAISTVIRLYNFYDEPLSKYANINEKQMEAFANGLSDATTIVYEHNSYDVADFILKELEVFTGIAPVSKLDLIFNKETHEK